jgi:hypothetical protein
MHGGQGTCLAAQEGSAQRAADQSAPQAGSRGRSSRLPQAGCAPQAPAPSPAPCLRTPAPPRPALHTPPTTTTTTSPCPPPALPGAPVPAHVVHFVFLLLDDRAGAAGGGGHRVDEAHLKHARQHLARRQALRPGVQQRLQPAGGRAWAVLGAGLRSQAALVRTCCRAAGGEGPESPGRGCAPAWPVWGRRAGRGAPAGPRPARRPTLYMAMMRLPALKLARSAKARLRSKGLKWRAACLRGQAAAPGFSHPATHPGGGPGAPIGLRAGFEFGWRREHFAGRGQRRCLLDRLLLGGGDCALGGLGGGGGLRGGGGA